VRWSSGTGMVAEVYSPNEVDIGRRLVSAAVVYRRYSTDHAEDEARKARRGMWRGPFVARMVATATLAGSLGSRDWPPEILATSGIGVCAR
jgi:hypothetical protein